MKVILEAFDRETIQAWRKEFAKGNLGRTIKVDFGVIQVGRTEPNKRGSDIKAQLILNYRGPFKITTAKDEDDAPGKLPKVKKTSAVKGKSKVKKNKRTGSIAGSHNPYGGNY